MSDEYLTIALRQTDEAIEAAARAIAGWKQERERAAALQERVARLEATLHAIGHDPR